MVTLSFLQDFEHTTPKKAFAESPTSNLDIPAFSYVRFVCDTVLGVRTHAPSHFAEPHHAS
jgi:hypothetical protein